jgi:site-specific DNA recombinase
MVIPRKLRVGAYVRISNDPFDTEKGVTRQREDVLALAAQRGWEVVEFYEENDTSAYKKRRIRLPDGRSVWRVVRPEFRRMLTDYEDGKIGGIIVYDLDRLARQNRDLEDLIDLVEHFKRPVIGVTGNLDLMTDSGKAMARVLVAMANKSSADTARRVARQKLQAAQEGIAISPVRPFGWQADRLTLEPKEADLLSRAALRYLAGESWASVTQMITASGVPTARGGKWRIRTVKNMILSPRIAGLIVYTGQARPELDSAEEESNGDAIVFRNPRDMALKDADGNYIRGRWKQIITVEQWETIVSEYEQRRDGKEFSSHNTRKHLLSGLLRCGQTREDGIVCNTVMVGAAGSKDRTSGRNVPIYRCPGKIHGGCGRSQRNMAKLDKLVEDLLFLHLEENRPSMKERLTLVTVDEPDSDRLTEVQTRLNAMREGMRDGTVSVESFFAVVPGLEKEEKKLLAQRSKAAREQISRNRQLRTPEEIREEWDNEATTAGRRALLGQYLRAVAVGPSQTRGPVFDHQSITPIWK